MNTKYDYALSQFPGRIIVVRCDTCGVDYDVRFVSNEVQHKGANHVMFFDCPKGHHCEARRLWKELQEQEKSELAQLNAEVRAALDKKVKLSATIETAAPATADPELGEWRCPNGHDSSLPPPLPELSFEACGHYRPTVATWNEFCITCGVRHFAFAIYWRSYEGRLRSRVNNPKNYCGYCGAKMVTVRASR
jgi:hypothetical protein